MTASKMQLIPVGKPFRGWQDIDPSWLSGEVGARYQYILRLMWDALGEYTRIGVNQRFPSLAQYSALEELGNDRLMPRGIAETDEHYRERLRTFRSTWRFAGNAPTLVKALYDIRPSTVSKIRYVCNGYNFGDGDIASNPASTATQFADWWTYSEPFGWLYQRAEPSNWDWDGNVTFLSNLNPQGYPIGLLRFWIIVYYDSFPTIPAWGGPEAWAEPGLFWGIGTDAELRAYLTLLYSVLLNFKSASSHMGPFPGYSGGLILADPAVTGVWGAGGPFDPLLPPGAPMPDGDWDVPLNRTPDGAIYLTGI